MKLEKKKPVTEMEAPRHKFERLPAFLKAGAYYTTKLEATR